MSAMVAVRAFGVGDERARSLRAAVVEAGERWSAGLRQLIGLVAQLDGSNEWAIDDLPTCAHWIASALDVELCTAREWIRIGRCLTRLPLTAAAFADGTLSYSKVRTLTRVATPSNEEELCRLAQQVPAGRLGHAMAAWLADHETPHETEKRHRKATHFSWRLDVDGMTVGVFRLPPAQAALITAPVDAQLSQSRSPDRDAPADASPAGWHVRWPTIGQQRADALVALVKGGGSTVTTEIVVHVRADGCTLDDGTPIAGTVVERIAPHAFLRALIHDALARPVNASGRQRHPTSRQRRVVRERDRTCVDCGATDFLEYDHQPGYEQTRHTLVDELHLRCWACHRSRHRQATPTTELNDSA
jgi:hypothetical protein